MEEFLSLIMRSFNKTINDAQILFKHLWDDNDQIVIFIFIDILLNVLKNDANQALKVSSELSGDILGNGIQSQNNIDLLFSKVLKNLFRIRWLLNWI